MRLPARSRRDLLYAKTAYVEARGIDAAVKRAYAIARRPSKTWKGRKVWRNTCDATGHVQWVPASMLWSLNDDRYWRCPYHS